MNETNKPVPTLIELHQKSRVLEIGFSDGKTFSLPYEFLRVHSPSAEVRGHGHGQEILQIGKKEVDMKAAEPVGTYAMVLIFSDGHETGIYTWEYLHSMGINQEKMWQEYLQRMDAAGAKREPAPNIIKAASAAGSCGSGGCGSK